MKDINLNLTQDLLAYTNILMKCVDEPSFFDEQLVIHILNYNPKLKDEYIFYNTKTYCLLKSNLWGYVKANCDDNQKLAIWANILNKSLDDEPCHFYLKHNFYDFQKRQKIKNFNPLFFKHEIKNNEFIQISNEFLKIIGYYQHTNDINFNKLTNDDIKLIFNDMLIDSNLNINLSNLDKFNSFNEIITKFFIDNFEEFQTMAKEKNKSVFYLISLGDSYINNMLKSLNGETRKNFFKKYNLEEQFLKYINYENNKNFYIYSLYNYRDKDFWTTYLNCYDKKNNTFSIKHALKDIVTFTNLIEDYFYLNNIPSNFKYYTRCISFTKQNENSYNRLFQLLDYFKEELINSKNCSEELEKFLISAIMSENETLFLNIKQWINNNNIQIKSYHSLYNYVVKEKSTFIDNMKEKEIMQFYEKLNNNIDNKNNQKKIKI